MTIDTETNDMIRRRLGEDVAAQLSASLEVKAPEVVRRDAKGGRKKPRGERPERGERKPREPR